MLFNPRDPDFRYDPYPTYARLREQAPILFWPEWSMWFVTRHADCSALLRSPSLGQVERRAAPVQANQAALRAIQSYWLLLLNPPEHTRLRGLVHKAFTPRVVNQMREQIQAGADGLIDRVQKQGGMDLVADFAYPLPVQAICTLLGVPSDDHPYFRVWTDLITRSFDLTNAPEVYERASVAAAEFTNYLDALFAERRRRPQADLFSALVMAEEAGDRLSREELFSICALLFLAGNETSVNLIGNGVLALMRHRSQWELLVANPKLAEATVEEVVRYDAPAQMISRLVQEEFEYGGITFEVGQQIGIFLGAAGRDPAQYIDPDQLDITRIITPQLQLSFGAGMHYCVGAPLARLTGAIAFNTLTRRCPNLALNEPSISYRDNFTLRGLKKLSVTF